MNEELKKATKERKPEGKAVWVTPRKRKDGKWVAGHWRRSYERMGGKK
jgi:hypothetical protein